MLSTTRSPSCSPCDPGVRQVVAHSAFYQALGYAPDFERAEQDVRRPERASARGARRAVEDELLSGFASGSVVRRRSISAHEDRLVG